MTLNEKQERMCSESQWDFSDLSALFLNCTLKKSPEVSHTRGLIDISKTIMEKVIDTFTRAGVPPMFRLIKSGE